MSLIVDCLDMSIMVGKEYLEKIPYFETFFSGDYSENTSINIQYNWYIFETVIKYANCMEIEVNDYCVADAIRYYMVLNMDDESIIKTLVNYQQNMILDNMSNMFKEYEIYRPYTDPYSGITHRETYNQIHNVRNMINIFSNYTCAYDYSGTGCGKTYTTCALAKSMGLPIFVICGKSISNDWIKAAKYMGVSISQIVTYQTFSSKKQKLGFFTFENGGFRITNKFIKYILQGALFVADEFVACKNDSWTTKAVITLVNYIHIINNSIREQGYMSESKFLGISATPMDKMEQIMNITRVLGFTKDIHRWYDIDKSVVPNRMRRTGFNKLCEFPKFSNIFENKSEYDEVVNGMYLDKTTMVNYITDFFISFKNNISSSMAPRPMQVIVNKLFMSATDEEEIEALKGYELMENAVNLNGKVNFENFMKGFIMVQKVKAYPIVRHALIDLENDPNIKIVLFLPYLESIDMAYNTFREHGYRVLRMTGKNKVEDRDNSMFLFAQDNNDYRIMITNTKISSMGIDLDDKHGNRKRVAYITPEYNFINIEQCIGRIDRIDTKSNSIANIAYLEVISKELDLLAMLNKKNEVLELIIGRKTKYSTSNR